MAVVSMKRLELYGLARDKKAVVKLLQRRGVVEIRCPEEGVGCFFQADTSPQRLEQEQNAHLLEEAVALADKYAPPKKPFLSLLRGRPFVAAQRYKEMARELPARLETAKTLLSLGKGLTDSQAQEVRLRTQLEALSPWLGLDLPLSFQGTRHTRAFIGSFPQEWDEAGLKNALAAALPEVPGIELEVLSSQPQQTCVFLLCRRDQSQQVADALRGLGFASPGAGGDLPPARQAEVLRRELQEEQRRQTEARAQIAELAKQRDSLLLAADCCGAKAQEYAVLGQLWQSPHAFCLTGYLPAEDAPGLLEELSQAFPVYAEAADPGPQEEVPVKLRNNFFTAPMEGVVAGYSLPSRAEVDPSAVMAFFYYVLFGLMLSDAAYGILMVLGCGFALWKFRDMEAGMRKSMRMFFFCGISTTVWGVLFGSYFGDVVPVVAETFFHTEVTVPALWFEPLSDPMRLLIFSFGVGVLHLFTGLGVQFYQLCRRKKYADALYDVVFWYLLVGGLILVLLSTELFQNIAELPFRVPGPVAMVAGALAGVGAVGIVCTAGRESRNPFKRFLKGLYGIYGVSSYLSDILSYSRLLALGLATSVISTVFNQLGVMLGGGAVGAVFFVVIFLIGHSMNMAINVLGAYVHTNRLQFVEFFGKFYEGGGKPYTPFAANTKHFRIKEEQ